MWVFICVCVCVCVRVCVLYVHLSVYYCSHFIPITASYGATIFPFHIPRLPLCNEQEGPKVQYLHYMWQQQILLVFLHSEILADFLFNMRESKLKSYKSAFMLSVVNNELFNDRGVFLY